MRRDNYRQFCRMSFEGLGESLNDFSSITLIHWCHPHSNTNSLFDLRVMKMNGGKLD